MMFLSIIIFFLHVFVVYVDEIHVEMQTNVYISDNLFKYNNKCLIFIRARYCKCLLPMCQQSYLYHRKPFEIGLDRPQILQSVNINRYIEIGWFMFKF
jgi:hypothetical protein